MVRRGYLYSHICGGTLVEMWSKMPPSVHKKSTKITLADLVGWLFCRWVTGVSFWEWWLWLTSVFDHGSDSRKSRPWLTFVFGHDREHPSFFHPKIARIDLRILWFNLHRTFSHQSSNFKTCLSFHFHPV